ncbi:right-handed parallel beta-helix repeat-containing protein, partial [Bacteroidota bacterium]
MKALKIILQLVVLICLFFFATDQILAQPTTIEVSGDITENTTWLDDTVKVLGDVTVNNNVILTISPGTYVEFQGHFRIAVNGYLKAEGLPGDTIVFTINDTTGATDPEITTGKWKGINFFWGNHNDTSIISFAHLSYSFGSIQISGSQNVIISDCHIEKIYSKSYGTIDVRDPDCNVLIQNCLIENNVCLKYGGGIFSWKVLNLEIKNNIIRNNYAKNGGGIYHMDAIGGSITGNIIKNNKANATAGIYCYGEGFEIIENDIVGNEVIQPSSGYGIGGISFSGAYNCKLINNSIINNKGYIIGGIYCSYSRPEIINNLIANNQGSSIGGIWLHQMSEPRFIGNTICNNQPYGLKLTQSKIEMINSILWGNTASAGNQIFIEDNFSSPDMYNCVVQGGISDFGLSSGTTYQGIYENNLETYPEFISPSSVSGNQPEADTANWSLQIISPSINKGVLDLTDLNIPDKDRKGDNRVLNGRIDIGAFEAHVEKISVSGTISTESDWVADTVEVTGDIYVPDNVTLTISPGTKVMFDGHFRIFVHGVLIAVGTPLDSIYFMVSDTLGFSDYESLNGSWNGIYFNNASGGEGANGAMNDNDSSVFSHCVIKHAKSTLYGGGIYIDHFSKIRIEDSKIIYCCALGGGGGGISCMHASPLITDCDLSNNFSGNIGAGFYCLNSNPHISYSIISDNEAYSGAGLLFEWSAPVIEKCLIMNNISHAGGGTITSRQSDPVISDCRIINNNYHAYEGSAIHYIDGSPVLINNLITNNASSKGSWPAVYFESTEDALLINNTISNNHSGIAVKSAKVRIFNTIIWESTAQVRVNDEANTTIDFYNCLIKGTISSNYFNNGSINDFINIIDSLPGFIDPTAFAGNTEDALLADWRLDQFSPCINSGTSDIPDMILPDTDINGLPRINLSLIDIGAYENQGGLPQIIGQPSGGTRCEDESFSISTETVDSSHYQWQKDGIDIQGEDQAVLMIDSVTISDQGNYWCLVNNSYGTVISNTATLFVNEHPEFLLEPRNMWAGKSETVTLSTYAKGTSPDYQWQKNGMDLPEEILPELILPDIDYPDEGIYACIISNSCGKDTTSPAELFLAPQICMVTVSTTTGHNLVVWEKKSKAPIMAYNIYRESVAAGIYDKLATISYDELSVLVDTIADPTVQAYLYKITAI